MVEGARLESVYTRKGIEGSNPFLSAIIFRKRLKKNRKVTLTYYKHKYLLTTKL